MFSFISCRTFKPTNFAALKNTVLYNNKRWGWTDICETDNPQASKHDKAKKLQILDNIPTFNTGCFPLNQNVQFDFSSTSSGEWNSIFKNFQKEDNLARYTQIFTKIFPEVFFQLNFSPRISRIFGWKVRISEIHQFLELPEKFPGNFCTCFQILESVGWMQSTVIMSTDIRCATERLTDSRVSYRSVFNLQYFE